MCPTYIATGEEIMSTRGRANAIRAALELRGMEQGDALASSELNAALSHCLSCKACDVECPSNVSMTLLKAELQYARIVRDGLTLRQRTISSVDQLGRFGTRFPWLANMVVDSFFARYFLQQALGISTRRSLLHFARERFDVWFARHPLSKRMTRGRVILWDDTFVRYHEPHIGIAAVKVLEAAGYMVDLPAGRECCGRPAFSQGNLAEAVRMGRHNLALLNTDDTAPILFLEPSCYSMFAEDYRELNLPDAAKVAARCFLFEEFIDDLLRREPKALQFNADEVNVVVHTHCHAKSLTDASYMHRLAMRLPDRRVTALKSGCCGMAGAFGAMASKYELSLKVAEPLIQQIKEQPFGTVVIASGTSCRQQIAHLAPVRPRHMAEVLAGALLAG
jgi:Fe-S oxidoreductase